MIAALMRGAKLEVEAEVTDALVELSEGHPLVIQHLVERFKRSRPLRREDVERELTDLLASDPLDLNHYLTRISDNFASEAAKLARAVLDELAITPGLTLNALLDRLGARADRTAMSEVLRQLIDDFYLVRADDGGHDFRLQMLRRFWMTERGLEIAEGAA